MSPPMDSKMNLLERVNCELILGRMNVLVVISDRTIVERFSILFFPIVSNYSSIIYFSAFIVFIFL